MLLKNVPLPETNSSPVKIGPWNLGDSYWKPRLLREKLVVRGGRASTFDWMVRNGRVRFHFRFGETHPESFVWFQDSERESFVFKKIVMFRLK